MNELQINQEQSLSTSESTPSLEEDQPLSPDKQLLKNNKSKLIKAIFSLFVVVILISIFLIWKNNSNSSNKFSINTETNLNSVSVKNSAPEPTPTIEPQIDIDQAKENIKNLLEVKSYLFDNSTAQVELYSTDEYGGKYIFHVYQQSPNTIKTFDWFEVNYVTGEIISLTKENPCPEDADWMCLPSSFLDDEYTLPPGWTASLSFLNSWGSEEGYQSIIESLDIKKGEYELSKYPNRSTGRASCIGDRDDVDNNYVLLNNSNLTHSFLLRNKEPETVWNWELDKIDENKVKFRFCAQVTGERQNMDLIRLDDICFANGNNNNNGCIALDDGQTLMGAIEYSVPKNPNPEIIEEMDKIVKSFR